ncbi:MAG: hypothetical protein H7Y38_10750 [Armatimonadetes bacterium]|nr:hypothetical protein [Armatimonadota bacterium]
METTQLEEPFANAAMLGKAIYNERLKSLLEPAQNGKAVAINVENGDYIVADSLKEARTALHPRYPGIVSMSRTIGVETDLGLLARVLAGTK